MGCVDEKIYALLNGGKAHVNILLKKGNFRASHCQHPLIDAVSPE
ncbi:hypothetical protein [Fibrobacter sp. UBA3629]|nr:hypothetical protein [Fibrobacter sp. UBA3629]